MAIFLYNNRVIHDDNLSNGTINATGAASGKVFMSIPTLNTTASLFSIDGDNTCIYISVPAGTQGALAVRNVATGEVNNLAFVNAVTSMATMEVMSILIDKIDSTYTTILKDNSIITINAGVSTLNSPCELIVYRIGGSGTLTWFFANSRRFLF